jgi:hypothetical protein
MSTSLSNNARAPYHLTLPDSVARAGTFFFLLFVFMWPFQLVPFLTDNLFGIQGFKLFNLLSAVVVAYLMFDTAPLHATDKIERTSIRVFLLYFATFAIALIRSVPNAPLLHSRFPVSFPESYFDFVLSACIVQTFYTLSFLFTLKRMRSFQELERITTVICLSILLLSIAFVALVLTNPSVLLSGHPSGMIDNDRDEMAQLCKAYFGTHYYCTLVAVSSSYARRSLDRTPVSVAPGGSSPRVTNRASHSSGFVLPISDPAAQVCHFSSWCCGGWRHIVGVDRTNRCRSSFGRAW